jgi:hypothetical protein
MNANGIMDGTDTFINGRGSYIYVDDQYYNTTTDINGYYQLILPKWGPAPMILLYTVVS